MRMRAGLQRSSLARRLVLLALVWSVGALAVTVVLLALLFRQAALGRLDETLNDLNKNNLAYSTVEDGQVFAPPFTDERALRVFSGRYWEIAEPTAHGKVTPTNRNVSHSLFDTVIATPPDLAERLRANPGKPIGYDAPGPEDQTLRVRAEQHLLRGRKTPVIFLAAGDRSSVDREVSRFIVATAAVFVLLGAGLILAIVIQVRVGLRPLFDLRTEVAAVRRGKAQRLAQTYPSELMPLAQELNALVEHNQQVVERQRTHVGNLAHALKTPIAVMINEAQQRPGPLADVVARQAGVMQKQVDHHLRRARAAARTQGQGERTSVAEVLDELSRTLGRIYRDQGVEIDWDAAEDLYFLGERQDIQEIAGNAVENACKWCRSRVRVRAQAAGPERFGLTVEDDGPGLPSEQRAEVVQRGTRLDETAPGSGLGLSIINELARAYGGSLTLSDSVMGGLCLSADLPRAQA